MSAQGVPVSLCGLSPGADREFLSGIRKSRFCSAAAAQNINLSWTTSRAQRWDGCSLIVHTRYVPAPEGARLEERDHWPETTPDCYAAFERYHAHRNAIAVGIEPRAVIINRLGTHGRS